MDGNLNGDLLAAVGLEDVPEAKTALASLALTPLEPEWFRRLGVQLAKCLPETPDPSFAFSVFVRSLAAHPSPTALLGQLEQDPGWLINVLWFLSSGRKIGEAISEVPEILGALKTPEVNGCEYGVLLERFEASLRPLIGVPGAMRGAGIAIRRQFQKEWLKIAYAEFVIRLEPAAASERLTVLADVVIESAVRFVRRQLATRYGEPRLPDGRPGRFSVISLGPLGGRELSYDASLDLLFLRDLGRPTDGLTNLPADEFYDQLAMGILELLDGSAAGVPPLYDVQHSHRPRTDAGSLALTTTEAYRHYQVLGRTWERLLYVKSRWVAGDESMANEFFHLMNPWVYRRLLEEADIEGLQMLAKKLIRRTSLEAATDANEALLAHGGLHDLAATVGLLQLINGGENESLRTGSTKQAILALNSAKLLTAQEAALLSDSWQTLIQFEHRSEAEGCPLTPESLQRIAWFLNYRDQHGEGDSKQLQEMLRVVAQMNCKVIQSLLQDAAAGAAMVPAETELVLDPEPDERLIVETMNAHRLGNPQTAMIDLQRLADEPVRFLSSRKCRHHLADIAPALLDAIGRTPDPCATLSTLVDVSDSLGGKAMLWELFATTPAAMALMVRLCACTPYLAQILVQNPGMLDELVDSLLLDRLPSERWLEASSIELARFSNESDISAVMASFKHASHLQIGVRDMLTKEPLEATHAALAHTAQCVVRRLTEQAIRELGERFGDPVDMDDQPIELVTIAYGKLGAREPNYFSNLDLAFIYTAEGTTRRRIGGHRATATASEFFSEVARRVRSRLLGDSKTPRMYDLEEGPRLFADSQIALAVSEHEFARYYRENRASLAQRMALCKARSISGSAAFRARTDELINHLVLDPKWERSTGADLMQLRFEQERSATPDNLKRAPGGTMDVEWIAQSLQLRHAHKYRQLLVPGTIDALQQLSEFELISPAKAAALITNYRMLREVESKLCLLNTPKRHEIPTDANTLELLAYLMDVPSGEEIMSRCRECLQSNRRMFHEVFAELVVD